MAAPIQSPAKCEVRLMEIEFFLEGLKK